MNLTPAPERIRALEPNQVFVFGSNARGRHWGGAAFYAWRRFGARWGQGHGRHGASYAIDTMSGDQAMTEAIAAFLTYAKEHPENEFLLTAIGCGIAGRSPKDIAPHFTDAPENVRLPATFLNELSKA